MHAKNVPKNCEANLRHLHNLNQCNYTSSRGSKKKGKLRYFAISGDNIYIYIDNSKIFKHVFFIDTLAMVKTWPNKTWPNPFKLKVNEVTKLIQKPTVPQSFINLW